MTTPSPLHLLPPDLGTEILRVQTGSRATLNLTEHQGADDDQMGIFIPTPQHLLGLPLNPDEQYQYRSTNNTPHPPDTRSTPQTTDLTVYSLRKFAFLAAQGNPTIITTLFAPPHHTLITSTLGNRLTYHHPESIAPAFLSRQVASKFLGFLNSQREGLTSNKGKHTNRPELIAQHGYDTKYAYHMLRLGFQGVQLLAEHTITLPMPELERTFLLRVRQGQISLQKTLEMADDLINQLLILKTQSTLPDEPDYPRINNFLIESQINTWLTPTTPHPQPTTTTRVVDTQTAPKPTRSKPVGTTSTTTLTKSTNANTNSLTRLLTPREQAVTARNGELNPHDHQPTRSTPSHGGLS